ncbi:hypothetical protein PYCCODRAFT_1430827 [Trametes coccinea BRFM310]|uniref:Uncharacterized protein n=1 Tax=Trametes coccinea (strain BRFM310) TaxID=1353009 RepID=A0A1Y2J2G7_TRAC3|nr:hypothetical protein PYCCODRAFT_1430827 [Trametes coccinea BRFM310]
MANPPPVDERPSKRPHLEATTATLDPSPNASMDLAGNFGTDAGVYVRTNNLSKEIAGNAAGRSVNASAESNPEISREKSASALADERADSDKRTHGDTARRHGKEVARDVPAASGRADVAPGTTNDTRAPGRSAPKQGLSNGQGVDQRGVYGTVDVGMIVHTDHDTNPASNADADLRANVYLHRAVTGNAEVYPDHLTGREAMESREHSQPQPSSSNQQPVTSQHAPNRANETESAMQVDPMSIRQDQIDGNTYRSENVHHSAHQPPLNPPPQYYAQYQPGGWPGQVAPYPYAPAFAPNIHHHPGMHQGQFAGYAMPNLYAGHPPPAANYQQPPGFPPAGQPMHGIPPPSPSPYTAPLPPPGYQVAPGQALGFHPNAPIHPMQSIPPMLDDRQRNDPNKSFEGDRGGPSRT